MESESITWVECPRDAWQGLPHPIPTIEKRAHLRHLLAAGFGRLDLGSFVSPRAVPQLADTEEVLAGLERPEGVDFLCIVANLRGVERAGAARGVSSVGYPLSINDRFQRRNVGRSLEESWDVLARMVETARAAGLEPVVYVSMGFGNPYGDPWQPEDTARAVSRIASLGVERIALADTVGTADADTVGAVLTAVSTAVSTAQSNGVSTAVEMGGLHLGLHLHARPDGWERLVDAALAHGVRWFEGALAGAGGCPFAGDALVGNLPTERVVPYLHERGFATGIDEGRLAELRDEASLLTTRYG